MPLQMRQLFQMGQLKMRYRCRFPVCPAFQSLHRQTKCYNNSGTITCPTSSTADFFGQDAYYASLSYCTPQSFSLQGSNASQMVVFDNNTGLMWQQKTTSCWYSSGAQSTYCDNLTYGGYSDWRLPTPLELLTIVDNSKKSPAIDTTYFPSTPSDNFCTSGTTGSARLLVNFTIGELSSWAASSSNDDIKIYIRCVRKP